MQNLHLCIDGDLRSKTYMIGPYSYTSDYFGTFLPMIYIFFEGDLQRAEERAGAGESKIVDLEEELRVIGENLKSLEVAEEKAQQREEEYKRQIKNLSERLKTAEARYVITYLMIKTYLPISIWD